MAALSDVVARNARALRAAGRWRQADVAGRAGMARSTLSTIEAGKGVTLEQLVAICRGLHVGVAELLDGADRADIDALGLTGIVRPGRG